MRRIQVVVPCIALVAFSVCAQDFRATITGQVADASNAAIAGATVALPTAAKLRAWGPPPPLRSPSGGLAWPTLTPAQPPGGYGQGQPASGTPTPAPTASGPV